MALQSNIEVVMVPFPAQSHLNQLLQLSHIISSRYNIKVHYVGSALHVSQAKSRATKYQTLNPNIEFHGFETPEFPSPPPSDPAFPSQFIPSFHASLELRRPVHTLLASLSSKRLVLIHDPMMSCVVQDSDELPNVEAYVFYCISAVSHLVMIRDSLGAKSVREDIPSPGVSIDPELLGFVEKQFGCLRSKRKAGAVFNTCRVIESEFLGLISEIDHPGADHNNKVWAFGPLENVTMLKEKPSSAFRHECMEWLDGQEANSVLYVSFGTTTFMVDDQIEELAKGLERSGAKFIWVLRDADKANIFDGSEVRRHKLPLGFEERVEGKGIGMVVRDWAPQLEILGHSSTGGFMSHCGWNSCLESLTLGVPLAAWPMHSDQPTNSFLVTQILKAGLVVREWEKRDELVSSSVISEVVKRLMSLDEGEGIRKRAEELGCELRKSTEEGGVSRLELDSFVAHITRSA